MRQRKETFTRWREFTQADSETTSGGEQSGLFEEKKCVNKALICYCGVRTFWNGDFAGEKVNRTNQIAEGVLCSIDHFLLILSLASLNSLRQGKEVSTVPQASALAKTVIKML